jgi:hypothetical protein
MRRCMRQMIGVNAGPTLRGMTDEQPASDLGPTDALFANYGQTMHAVQVYEINLATLTFVVMLAKSPKLRRSGEDEMVKKIRHLSQRATANEMRGVLDGAIDEQLLNEIVTLIGWRNFLAHRYLRTRFYDTRLQVHATDEQIDELERLRVAFAEGIHPVTAAREQIAMELFDPDADTTMDQREQALLMKLLQGAPPVFESVLTTPAEIED